MVPVCAQAGAAVSMARARLACHKRFIVSSSKALLLARMAALRVARKRRVAETRGPVHGMIGE
jgi:hypothetical protein